MTKRGKTAWYIAAAGCMLLFSAGVVSAQPCVRMLLPDTLTACAGGTVSIPTIIEASGMEVIDTQWTPVSGLSDPGALQPVVAMGDTPVLYRLTVKALSAFDYVVNGDFSNGNTGFTSDYTYRSGGGNTSLLLEGNYTITHDPSLAYYGFTSFGDHTTGAGQMLVANGAPSSGMSVWCQTIHIQPNTDYYFSAWAASSHEASPAVLRFAINGRLLGAPTLLSSTPGEWQEFHLQWNSGTSTVANICIFDMNTDPYGNDFVIDDIKFRQVCTASDSVYIRIGSPEVAIDARVTGCGSVLLHAVYEGASAGTQYTWDLGDGHTATGDSVEHTYAQAGIHTVTLYMTDVNGCADTATLETDTRTTVTVTAGAAGDAIDCSSPSVRLTATAGFAQYRWSPGRFLDDSTIAGPVATITPPETTTFTVHVTDAQGCSATDTVTVFADPEPGLFVPNAFTPNYDGRNDLMRPLVYCDFMIRSFRIFNRWGIPVYEGNAGSTGWDGYFQGVPQPAGTYFYLIEGVSETRGAMRLKGDFVLVR